MSPARLLYRLAVGTARLAAPLIGSGSGKIARGLAGRRRAHEVLARWGEQERDPGRPTVWFHAPSVGESLQAGAVIEALRARLPEVQVVLTYFSPSAVAPARQMPVDVSGYLPWDLRSTTGRVLDTLRPELLVFTKTEVWPVLVDEAVRRNVPVALVAGTVSPHAGRMRRPARAFLRGTWRSVAAACAIADADADRLRTLGVPAAAVAVTGDPAIDSAAKRAGAADPAAPHLAPFHADPRPTVIAGSTWPADEDVLLAALVRVRGRVPGVRAVIAPHEPHEEAVDTLLRRLEGSGWSTRTLSGVEAEASAMGVDAVVVDRVGVLAELYTIGDVAYVGGGFHEAGLHSVLEPAAAGRPVVFGPRHERSSAAPGLLDHGAATVVRDAEELAASFALWLGDEAKNDYAGARAFGYIDAHRGAAERTADILTDLLGS